MNVKILLVPAVALIQRRGLLRKLAIVTTMFLVPLMLALGLLYAELHSALTTAERERASVRNAFTREELVQQHRARRHHQLSDNASMQGLAVPIQDEVSERLAVPGAFRGKRDQDEVLKSPNQTSVGELDSLLAQRIELLRARLHMTILAALGVLVATTYLLARFYVWLPVEMRELERARWACR